MASMSVSGVVSGMDWESMIDNILESAQKPAMVQVNKKTNLTNKKSLFEEMKVTMNSIQTSLSPLKLASTYKAKEIEIERIDTSGSYKGVLTATVNADAEVNVYDLKVNQLATAQANRSKQITSSTLKSTLGNIESSKMYINAGGQQIGIDVYNTDTLESLKSRINTTLKTLSTPLAVTASVVDNKLILKSDYTGLGTTSVTGTTRDKYNSSGFTDLGTIITNADSGAYTNIVVDENNLDNLKVMSGTKTYSLHTDYEVVNNQIRWKQYEDTDNVKLGESVSASYTMGVGDVFGKTVKKTSGTTDSVSLGFDVIDNGTLSQRMSITGKNVTTTTETKTSLSSGEEVGTTTDTATKKDDYNNEIITTTTTTITEDEDGAYNVKTTVEVTKTFYYGKDFTFKDGTVTWLEQASTTNEPDSYTVSYSTDATTVYYPTYKDIVEGTRGSGTTEDKINIDVDEFSKAYKKAIGSDVPTLTLTGSDNVTRTYLDPADTSLFKLTDKNGTEYKYGRDYVINLNDNKDGYVVSWRAAKDSNGDGSIDEYDANIAVSTYADEKNISLLDVQAAPDAATSYTFSLSIQGEVTRGSTDDDEINIDVDEFSKAYKKATGSDVPTLTLTGSDKVIRTYLDPADTSLFKLTGKDGTEYEYGRDYVIRVKDDGDGYVVSWFAATDSNGDGSINALDANIAASTYAQEKNISLLGLQTAPDTGKSYTFALSGTQTKKYSASVKSSDDDKDLTLTGLLGKDLKLDEDDYKNIVIKDSDGTKYTYGTDFKITDGKIVWLDTKETYKPSAPDKGTEYTIKYESFKPTEVEATYNYSDDKDFEVKLLNDYGKISDNSNSYLSYEQILKDANSKLTADSDINDIDDALAEVFTLTDEEGNTYTYGVDYRIAMLEDDKDKEAENHSAVLQWINGGDAPANNTKFTISYTGRGKGGGEVFEIKDAVTRSNSDVIVSGSPDYNEFKTGTTTINQGSKIFYEGVDYEVGADDDGNVLINWKTGTNYEWYFPASRSTSQYTINLTTEKGETKTYTATRGYEDTLDLRSLGFTKMSNNGTLNSITYDGTTYDLTSTSTDDDGKTPSDLVRDKLGIDLTESTNGGVRVFNFAWTNSTLTSRDNLPGYGDDISIDYEYNVNTFSLSDDGDGVIDALGLNDDITEAQNAILVLDGEEVQRDSNDIGESYENELIKGMTLHLKGTGEVSMDVSHDAEKAVESIQTFVDNYNSLMSWINTRMTESQVDDDTAATIDSDDFRMRWGLLHGNSLLRNTKSQMRDITAQNFTYSFTSRTSSDEIYGSMAYNGLKTDSTLRLRINSTYVDVPVLMTDTLQDIADKISDSSNAAMKNIFYDADGNLLDDPLIKAKVEGDKLVISSSSNAEITMSGTAAMNALKVNYTYKGVYQLGIATTSTDYGKSGELEFDSEKFMTALEDNPDEVQALMLKYASAMDKWTKSMLNSSSSGATSGTLTRQIEDIDKQINNINEYLEKYQERIDRMEENLRTKYAAAEQRISKLSQQASAISAILQQLSGNGNNNNNSASS